MEQQDIMYFAAGGAVRDLLLGRAYRDVDFTFAGSEQDFIQRNPSARQLETGNSAIYFLHGQEYGLLQKSGMDLRKAIESDLLRRDFTINSLLLSPSGILHAHPQALCDLRKKWIRPASASSLADDPVRVLRAARFCAAVPSFLPLIPI